jgi:hypothetical protein
MPPSASCYEKFSDPEAISPPKKSSAMPRQSVTAGKRKVSAHFQSKKNAALFCNFPLILQNNKRTIYYLFLNIQKATAPLPGMRIACQGLWNLVA